MKKWYVVYEGRVPGVYDEWEDCLKQVNKFKGNNYKGYKSKEEAEARYMNHLLAEERKKNRMKTFIIIPILPS
jgi:ribonuclease HI